MAEWIPALWEVGGVMLRASLRLPVGEGHLNIGNAAPTAVRNNVMNELGATAVVADAVAVPRMTHLA